MVSGGLGFQAPARRDDCRSITRPCPRILTQHRITMEAGMYDGVRFRTDRVTSRMYSQFRIVRQGRAQTYAIGAGHGSHDHPRRFPSIPAIQRKPVSSTKSARTGRPRRSASPMISESRHELYSGHDRIRAPAPSRPQIEIIALGPVDTGLDQQSRPAHGVAFCPCFLDLLLGQAAFRRRRGCRIAQETAWPLLGHFRPCQRRGGWGRVERCRLLLLL